MRPRTHIGQSEFNKVVFLPVCDRVQELKLNLVFKIFNGTCPEYLRSNFTRLNNTHQHSTRGSPFNFLVPRIKGSSDRTFFFTGIELWNSPPNAAKQIKNVASFKLYVKNYLANKSLLAEQCL